MNPILGVFFHWLGGLAAGSFYAPYRKVRHWAWETYWLVGGVFSWIIAPWVFALLMVPETAGILAEAGAGKLLWPYVFGVLWGVGGLTFGLTMRYLGMSLGMAVALGYCAVFGTLVPPVFHGTFVSEVLGTRSGLTVLAGIAVCVIGIAVAGLAGMSKERELPAEAKAASVKEFDFRKGLLVATVSGIMSSCFAFGLSAGDGIKEIAAARGAAPLWQGLPVLIVVMAGGFTTNGIWCVILNFRNGTGRQYFSGRAETTAVEGPEIETALEAPSEETFRQLPQQETATAKVPLVGNWIFCALAGTIWYFQFFFYSMGESQMGKYGFSSWTMHMASIIIFSSLWGIALKEWKGTSPGTRLRLAAGLALLVFSTVVVGYGNYLGAEAGH